MALFLDFSSTNPSFFSNPARSFQPKNPKLSLNDQFASFSGRLMQPLSFYSFLDVCFRSSRRETELCVSAYAVDEMKFDQKGHQNIVDNIVLTIRKNDVMHSVFPAGKTLMMVGAFSIPDSEFNRFAMFIVHDIIFAEDIGQEDKGQIINERCYYALESPYWGRGGEFNGLDANECWPSTIWLKEFMEFIKLQNNRLGSEAKGQVEDWGDYLGFRDSWLNNAAKNKGYDMEKCEALTAYNVPNEEGIDYPLNEVLDGKKEFSKNPVILKLQPMGTNNATRENFIKATFSFLKKSLTKKEEKDFRSFIRQGSAKFSQGEVAAKKQSSVDRRSVEIPFDKDDVVQLIRSEVEPDYSAIEEKYGRAISSECADIDKRYEAEAERNAKEAAETKRAELIADAQQKLLKLRVELQNNLDSDVAANPDPDVQTSVKEKAKAIAKERSVDIKDAMSEVDVRALYVARNEARYKAEEKRMDDSIKEAYERSYSENLNEWRHSLGDKCEEEKKNCRERNEKEETAEKERKAEEETRIVYEVYIYSKVGDDKKIGSMTKCLPDIRMEKAKLDRQTETLQKLREGSFANPRMGAYVFNPESIPSPYVSSDDNIEWINPKLNDSQKEAVRKSIAAHGIALVQGPPGTGKTTVIAELAAQFVKRGMKVLISSETHKAVDNAFDELAKLSLPQVRMLRLGSADKNRNEGNKDDEMWSQSRLTANFYNSIVNNIERSVGWYRDFEKSDDDFYERLGLLRSRLKLLEVKQSESEAIAKEEEEIQESMRKAGKQSDELQRKSEDCNEQLSKVRRTLKWADELDFSSCSYSEVSDMDDNDRVLRSLRDELYELLSMRYSEFSSDMSLIAKIAMWDVQEMRSDLHHIENPDNPLVDIEVRISSVRSQMKCCKDDNDDVVPSKKGQYNDLKSTLIELNNRKNALMTQGVTAPNLAIHEYVSQESLSNPQMRDELPQRLLSLQEEIRNIKRSKLSTLQKDMERLSDEVNEIESKREANRTKRREAEKKLRGLRDDTRLVELKKEEKDFTKSLSDFFSDFKLTTDHGGENFRQNLEAAEKEWEIRSEKFDANKSIYKTRMSALDDIRRFIIAGGAIERDAGELNRRLVGLANVIGLTSSANDRQNVGEDKFYLGQKGIDVVIIDEVSKSSFIDMLRPMSYGQKVILVGDHMQLPPMYDLKHLKDEAFEGVDENVIKKDINDSYTQLVETCQFEQLFGRVPESNRSTLTSQYRFHSQIMDINPFYEGKLQLGCPDLDNSKNHNVEIKAGIRTIVSHGAHVCFIDSGLSYESSDTGSTSFFNQGEVDCVCEILRQLSLQIGDRNKLSVGVVCTYRSQARKIKYSIQKNKKVIDVFKKTCPDEKFICSTVDDFQGDERDVIIMSMVRNPKNRRYSNPDFIKQYQRINVAITRPRKLLIIVGAADFLSQLEVDVPSLDGKNKRTMRVFKNIIEAADNYRAFVSMRDLVSSNFSKVNNARRN